MRIRYGFFNGWRSFYLVWRWRGRLQLARLSWFDWAHRLYWKWRCRNIRAYYGIWSGVTFVEDDQKIYWFKQCDPEH